MKMILVGPPRQGKSTLLEILQTGKAPQVAHSEATIRTTKWELQRPAGSKAKVKDGGHEVGGRELSVGCSSPPPHTLGTLSPRPKMFYASLHQLLPSATDQFFP